MCVCVCVYVYLHVYVALRDGCLYLDEKMTVVLLEYPLFPNQCSILIFKCMLLLLDWQTVKNGNLPKSSGCSQIGKYWIEKYFQFFPSLKSVLIQASHYSTPSCVYCVTLRLVNYVFI